MKRTDGGTMTADDPTRDTDSDYIQVAQRRYEPNGQGELTTAVIYAIAEADGVSPSEIKSPPLYESVDVPAIEAAFFGPDIAGDSRQGAGTVEFEYTDYLVKIRSDGWVQIYESTEADHS